MAQMCVGQPCTPTNVVWKGGLVRNLPDRDQRRGCAKRSDIRRTTANSLSRANVIWCKCEAVGPLPPISASRQVVGYLGSPATGSIYSSSATGDRAMLLANPSKPLCRGTSCSLASEGKGQRFESSRARHSPRKRPNCVTHVIGMNCHPSLRKVRFCTTTLPSARVRTETVSHGPLKGRARFLAP